MGFDTDKIDWLKQNVGFGCCFEFFERQIGERYGFIGLEASPYQYFVGYAHPEITNERFRFARKKKILHWVGTDVTMYQGGLAEDVVNLVDAENLRDELEAKGVKVHGVVHHEPKHMLRPIELPQRRALTIYMPPARHDFFRYDLMREVVHALGDTHDVNWIGGTLNRDLGDVIARTSVYLRCPLHDGFSHTSAEMVMAGRTVLTTNDRPYQIRVKPDVDDIVSKMDSAPNDRAPEHYRNLVHRDRLYEALWEIIHG